MPRDPARAISSFGGQLAVTAQSGLIVASSGPTRQGRRRCCLTRYHAVPKCPRITERECRNGSVEIMRKPNEGETFIVTRMRVARRRSHRAPVSADRRPLVASAAHGTFGPVAEASVTGTRAMRDPTR